MYDVPEFVPRVVEVLDAVPLLQLRHLRARDRRPPDREAAPLLVVPDDDELPLSPHSSYFEIPGRITSAPLMMYFIAPSSM